MRTIQREINPRNLVSTNGGLTAFLLVVLFSCQLFFAHPAFTAQPAGKVSAASGEVTAAGRDGAIRQLAVDAPVFAGDIISTGPNSKVRIVFSDNGVIFLRPSSRFVIDAYKHSGKPGQDESKFSLVRGGFRSVTGAIGQTSKENYQIKTPVATIGIRGTDHEGRFCAADCFDLVNIGVNAPPDGLYTGTTVGQTQIGDQQFKAGEYGYTSPERVTIRLPEPPPILAADPHIQGAFSMKGAAREEKEKKAAPPQEEAKKEEKPQEEKKPDEKKPQPAQEEKKPEQPKSEQAKPEPQSGQGERPAQQGQAPAGQPSGAPAQPEPPPAANTFEIPAQPPSVRAVQCF